ncbi:hypothetical protein BJ742DRAFT_827705 [Cladochytrium replicatum]|nr:hypothetical protein BJ742DRAFT_827705 [Cladochytrium replicatum]
MDDAVKQAQQAAANAAASSAFQTASTTVRDAATAWYKNISLATGTIAAASIVLSVIDTITIGTLSGVFCLKANLFLFNFHRFFTYPYYHSGIISFVLDIALFVPLAAHLERQVGTIQAFWFICIVFTFLLGLFYVTIFAPFALIASSLTTGCAVGLSGVIFTLLSADSNAGAGPFETRTMFGVTIVGAMWPWIALVIAVLFYPWSSIVVHLGGILLGFAYSAGYLSALQLPARVVGLLESSNAATWLSDRAIFVPNPNPDGGLPMPGGIPG